MARERTRTNQPEPELSAGKLPPALLARLLADLPTEDAQLLLGPAIGEDAAVIDFSATAARLLVVKSDPITFATDEIGHYAVQVCANDLAVTGATPRFYLPIVLLPAGATTDRSATAIFAQIGAACRRLDIVVAGGHSEITHAVNQPVVAGTMLGEVERLRVVHSGGAQVGDCVLVAGAIPIEGVSLLAREKQSELHQRGWPDELLLRAADYLHQPGISIVEPALTAAALGLVTAMHDPTEGGIVTGLRELAIASDVGLEIDLDAIPVDPLGAALCAAFELDPLGTIASGALLATCAPHHVESLLVGWRDIGWSGTMIGRITPAQTGLRGRRAGTTSTLPVFAADEITKLFR